MNHFAAYLESWNPFYIALVGACAVLMGLIFLAVSIRTDLFTGKGNSEPKSVAWQTFLNFFWVFVIGITFLIPGINLLSLGIILAVLGLAGNAMVMRRWWEARGHLSLKRALIAFLPLMLCYTGITVSSLVGALVNYSALSAIAPILIFLIGVATYNAWELMFRYQEKAE
jgi:hypothetical protein